MMKLQYTVIVLFVLVFTGCQGVVINSCTFSVELIAMTGGEDGSDVQLISVSQGQKSPTTIDFCWGRPSTYGLVGSGMTSILYHNHNAKNPADDIIKIRSLNVTPTPIQVPGSVSVSLVVDVTKTIDGNLRADVILKRKLGPLWITVPCFNNIGSCTYADVCSFLRSHATHSCPAVLREMNITCSCPIAAGTYTLPRHSFQLDNNVAGINIPLLAGEYQTNVRFTDSNTQGEIACFDAEVKLTDPPSSSILSRVGSFFSNLFGR